MRDLALAAPLTAAACAPSPAAWTASPGAASSEMLVRRTYAPTWERVISVGADTTYVLDGQLDDVDADVRAVGANGHRSLVASIPAPAFPRQP